MLGTGSFSSVVLAWDKEECEKVGPTQKHAPATHALSLAS